MATGKTLLLGQRSKTVRFEKQVQYPKEFAATSTNWRVKKEPAEVTFPIRSKPKDTSVPSDTKCFNCNQKGHRARDCLIKPKIAAVAEASDDEDVVYQSCRGDSDGDSDSENE